MSELEGDALAVVRKALLAMMSDWSEDTYCAGWLIDLESRLHREGGQWETIGRMVGWPIGCDAEDGWETWDEAAARYESDEWKAARPWLRATTPPTDTASAAGGGDA